MVEHSEFQDSEAITAGKLPRRAAIRGLAAVGLSAVVGGTAVEGAHAAMGTSPLRRIAPPSAPANPANRRRAPASSHVGVHWSVDLDRKLVALTFDDGPMPNWTPMVLDTLEKADAPATFFMVGQRAVAHAKLLDGRLRRHEVGNHTWAHQDLSLLDADEAQAAISRAHDVIGNVTGQQPQLLRPPYGHLGGSTLLAAAELGYDLALWSLQMLESELDTPTLTRYVVEMTVPGTILLAHDTGNTDRLVALRGLPEMIAGLRARGFELMTVSGLLTAGAIPGATPR
jgi:peptidoglycan-N-acetylglucosamine deacetylase